MTYISFECNNHAHRFALGNFMFYFSYNTLLAYSDGSVTYRTVEDNEVDRVVTKTSSKHLNYWFGAGKDSYKKLPYKKFELDFYFKKINNV